MAPKKKKGKKSIKSKGLGDSSKGSEAAERGVHSSDSFVDQQERVIDFGISQEAFGGSVRFAQGTKDVGLDYKVDRQVEELRLDKERDAKVKRLIGKAMGMFQDFAGSGGAYAVAQAAGGKSDRIVRQHIAAAADEVVSKKKVASKMKASVVGVIDTGGKGLLKNIPKTALSKKFAELRFILQSADHDQVDNKYSDATSAKALGKIKDEDIKKLFTYKDEYGFTLAQYATMCPNKDLAAKALHGILFSKKYKYNVNDVDRRGQGLFLIAVSTGNLDAAEIILQRDDFILVGGESDNNVLKALLTESRRGLDVLKVYNGNINEEKYFDNIAKIANILCYKDSGLLYENVLFDIVEINLFELLEKVLKIEKYKNKVCEFNEEAGSSPFVYAIRKNFFQSVKVFLDSGAISSDAVNEKHEYHVASGGKKTLSPLEVACQNNFAEAELFDFLVIRALIEGRAEIKQDEDYGDFKNFLQKFNVIKKQYGEDENRIFRDAQNLAYEGNTESLESCLKTFVNINGTKSFPEGFSPEYKGSHISDGNKRSLLCCAIDGGQIETVKFLIQQRAYVSFINGEVENEGSNLYFAFLSKNIEIIDVLIGFGAALTNVEEENLLFSLVDIKNFDDHDEEFYIELINRAVMANCDLQAVNEKGNGILCEAIISGNISLVKCLLSRKINLKNKENKAALKTAVENKQFLIAEMLLMHGAEIDDKSFELAKKSGDKGFVETFRIFKREIPDYSKDEQCSILHKLISYNTVSLDFMESFITESNIDTKNTEGLNAIEYFLKNNFSLGDDDRKHNVFKIFMRKGLSLDNISKEDPRIAIDVSRMIAQEQEKVRIRIAYEKMRQEMQKQQEDSQASSQKIEAASGRSEKRLSSEEQLMARKAAAKKAKEDAKKSAADLKEADRLEKIRKAEEEVQQKKKIERLEQKERQEQEERKQKEKQEQEERERQAKILEKERQEKERQRIQKQASEFLNNSEKLKGELDILEGKLQELKQEKQELKQELRSIRRKKTMLQKEKLPNTYKPNQYFPEVSIAEGFSAELLSQQADIENKYSNQEILSQIRQKIINGELQDFQDLLPLIVDINATEELGANSQPLIYLAILYGAKSDANKEIIKILIENGAKCDVDIFHFTSDINVVNIIVQALCEQSRYEDLIKSGKFSEIDNNFKIDAVIKFIKEQNVEMLTNLFDAGFDPCVVAPDNMELMSNIAKCVNSPIFDLFLEKSKNPLCANSNGFSILHGLAISDSCELFESFLGKIPHSNIDIASNRGLTPLFCSIISGVNARNVEILLNQGADIFKAAKTWREIEEKIADNESFSDEDKNQTLQLLKNNIKDRVLKIIYKDDPLAEEINLVYLAALNGFISPNEVIDNLGNCLIHYAARFGNGSIFEALSQIEGCDIHVKNWGDLSAFSYAVANDRIDKSQLLEIMTASLRGAESVSASLSTDVLPPLTVKAQASSNLADHWKKESAKSWDDEDWQR